MFLYQNQNDLKAPTPTTMTSFHRPRTTKRQIFRQFLKPKIAYRVLSCCVRLSSNRSSVELLVARKFDYILGTRDLYTRLNIAYSSQQWLATSSYYIKTCLAKLLSSPFPFTWSRLVSTRGNLPWRNIWIWDTRRVGGTHQSLTLHNIFSWFYNSYSDYITNTKLYSLNWAS